jgi:hypothetical protein
VTDRGDVASLPRANENGVCENNLEHAMVLAEPARAKLLDGGSHAA